ncbi:3-oxo-tetronate kinase [Loktanella sp. DJP18]|uniref:3-oxo-tetronate kinase n=1 Tax=Loktanella sp. DJP18 TaxID=3409788 RepID=UPI003BB705B4
MVGGFFGAIADDFTGATDLAGLLARSGQPVSLRMGVPEGGDAGAFEVIALKIRTVPVDQAVAQVLAAVDWLQARGVQRFFWKYCSTFDSTDRGNIGPVAEAIMERLDVRQTIYCPAFPENGRSVFMGNLFVGQQPLAESPMKDHPLTPMRDSNLMRLLRPQVSGDLALIDRLTVAQGPEALRAALDATDAAHVIVDAVADDDLRVIAAACRDDVLMTGGSAVAMPLPGLYGAAGLVDAVARVGFDLPQGPALVLSGSCSAMTQRQVAAYAACNPCYHLDPLALDRDGVQPVIDWLAAQQGAPLVSATASPDAVRAAQDALGRARAGQLVEDTLVAIAVSQRELGVRRFVVAGGETSGAVTQALGVTRLDVGPEIAPGVPWCAADSDGVRVALALKSGNFGAADFFARALA